MLDRGAPVDQITWYIASFQTEAQAVDAMTRLANFPTCNPVFRLIRHCLANLPRLGTRELSSF
eukprot:7096273-Prymnesium_polylepis.1